MVNTGTGGEGAWKGQGRSTESSVGYESPSLKSYTFVASTTTFSFRALHPSLAGMDLSQLTDTAQSHEDEHTFKVNETFAEAFQTKKRVEELSKRE